MKALSFPGDRQVHVTHIPVPEIKDDEVLLEIMAAGLCGSDLHLFYRPSAREREEGIYGLNFPIDNIPGHEPAGRVVKVGGRISYLKPGDRVAVAHISGCSWCRECRQGWDMHCKQKQTYGGDRQGAYAEYMAARERDCVILPDNVSYADGSYYTCGASTGYYAMRRANLVGGEAVAVVGLGPVGLAGAFFAKQMGAHVIGIDISDERCAFALKHGVDVAINSAREDVLARVKDLTGGELANVAVDFTGNPAGRLTALDVVGLWGRVVMIGFGEGRTAIDIEMQVIEKQLTVTGAWVFSFPELQRIVDHASRRDIDLTPLTRSLYDIDDGPRAFQEFDRGSLGKSFIVRS